MNENYNQSRLPLPKALIKRTDAFINDDDYADSWSFPCQEEKK